MTISSIYPLSINLTKFPLKQNLSKILAFHFLFLTFFLSVVASNGYAQQMRESAIIGPTPAPQITGQPSSSSICAGANTTFTVAASNATSYRWKVDYQLGEGYVNVPNAAPYSGVTSAMMTITAATVDMSTYQYKVEVTGATAPMATSNPVTLTVGQAGHWLGKTDGNWSTAANWGCGKIPDATTNVVILNSADFSPQIDVPDAYCNDLTIENGKSLSFVMGQLHIKGNMTISGEFDRTTGPVIFSGDGQVVPGGEYIEIGIAGGATVTLGGDVRVTSILGLEDGYIKLGDNDLVMAASPGEINGGNSDSFIVTDGKGELKIEGLGSSPKTGTITFPVGISVDSYTPVSILNTGTTDVFGVRVIEGIYTSYDTDGTPATKLTTNNVDRTWFVTEGVAGSSNATLTFNWIEDDELEEFSRNECFAAHYTGGKWVSGVSGAADEGEFYSTSLSGITTFSPFGVGSAGSVLPLKLLSFTAALNTEHVALKWETASEVNTEGFEIQMSKNASNFKKVGFVKSFDANSTSTSKYYFNSTIPAGVQTSYYRLKLLDQDGTFAYSRIVKLQHSDVTEEYQVYPNPVQQEYLTVKPTIAKTGPIEVIIFDTRGTVRYKSKIDSNPFSLDPLLIPMKSLDAGSIYVVQITEVESGTNQRIKFFKK